jgi:hypothetical protein
LGVEFKLQLAAEILPHEFRVLADIGRHHLLHLPGLKQDADAEIIHARIVAGEGEIPDARVADGKEQQFGDAAEAEAARSDQHVVVQKPVERLGCRAVNLGH